MKRKKTDHPPDWQKPDRADFPAGEAPRKRILVVDDHPVMRAGLAQLIDRQPDCIVCGEAGAPVEALRILAQSGADLVLTDLTMPGRSGLEFIKDIQSLYPELPVLVISMHDEIIYADRVLRAGARGYIMKEAGGEKLLEAIRHVLGGQVYVSGEISAVLLDTFAGKQKAGSLSPFGLLTDREFEIFQLIGLGRNTRDIAKQLGLSPKTVDVHRANLKGKLDLKDATSLVRHAVRWVETQ